MRGFLSQKGGRARHLGISVGATLGLSVGISLCGGALIAGPLSSVALAAPTLGGDENGPQVQILKPAYQDVLKGKTSIMIAVKTRKFNPQFVEMFIDDKPATTAPIPIGATASAQYDWNTKLFSDGPHKLTVRVTDTQGFRGWAEVNIFINNQKRIDTAPPSLSWKNTTSFDQLSGVASIEVQALDNFGVKMLMVSLKSASETDKKASVISWFLNRPPYIVKFDTTKVPDGLYELTAKAYDSFEQEGDAPPLTLGVVNNGVNATTVGDMLANMARIDISNRKSFAQFKPKEAAPQLEASQVATPQVATPQIDKIPVDAAKQTQSVAQRARTAVIKAKGSATTKTTRKVTLLPSVPATLPPVIVRSVQATVKTPSKIANPPKIARLTIPQISKASEVEASEVEAPQLSTRSSATIARALPNPAAPALTASALGALNVQNEIKSALRDDWRNRLARAVAPDAPDALENQSSEASLSAPKSPNTTRISAQEFAPNNEATTVEENTDAGRTSLPVGTERSLDTTVSVDGAPLWSEAPTDLAPRLTPNVPLQVETPETTRAGRLSVPPTRIARAEAEASSPDTGPRISEFSTAVEPKISAREVIKARLEKALAPRTGKMASPETRLSALPRPQKSGRGDAISAITVSPLQVNVSDALPAFHVAARSTDLRAVAARYGLPVDVIAANNGWKTDKTLVAGERVKLPKQLKVAYHGVPVTSDVPSMLVGGTGVTAFRFMFEMAGGKLVWDAKKQRVIARKGESEVVLNIGSNRAQIGDQDVMMELAAFLFEGRTMVPLRFFEEGLHAQVEWDPQTGRLMVAMAG